MRRWVEYLINQPSICADFIEWADEAVKNLQKAMSNYVMNGEMDKAKGAAHEVNVYEKIRDMVKKELREQVSTAQYEETGGN